MKFEDIKRVSDNLKTVDIKGKQYAEVNKRVMAFRELEPNGSISTEIMSIDNGVCIVKATVTNSDGFVLATGLAYEKEGNSFINKTSYIENCETSAIGRALGFIGIGIDTSIASLEEVENAKLQQENLKPATKAEKKMFMDYCEALNVPYKDILKQVGVDGQMTKEQHGKALIILKE